MPTALPRLSSRQHSVVLAFKHAASHPDAGVVLLDGAHLIGDALAAGIPVKTVLASREFLTRAAPGDRQVVRAAAESGAVVYDATAAVLSAASPVRTSSGVVGIAEWRPSPPAAIVHRHPALVVGLMGVQDPGNVGAVIRSADGLGATGVLALDDTAHPGGWKALRGAMGSTFRVPVGRCPGHEGLAAARAAGLRVYAAASRATTPIDAVDWTRPALILLGSEGAGVPPEIAATADERISIPMRAGIESLNVAVTAALVLYEARHARSLQ